MIRRRWQRPISGIIGVLIISILTLATMSWTEPPRYDGAGYATLGKAIAEGRGYRDISRPDAPRHTHFPPAYPGLLALLWKVSGTDNPGRFTILAHAASLACMALGVWSFGRWWSSTEPREVATCLTLALAVNWTWVKTGGVIRSEPLAVAIGGLALLVARRLSSARTLLVGLVALIFLLGFGMLTRQVFACWVFALALDLGLHRGRSAAIFLLGGVAILFAPWAFYQVRIGEGTQSGLFRREGLLPLVADQSLFYARRIPDSIAGPFIEVATVFGRSSWLSTLASAGGIAATSVVIFGWVRLVRSPVRRLGGLIPLATLPLLLVWPFTEAGRFLIPLVPFVLMAAVEGGAFFLRKLGVDRPEIWASRLVLAISLPYSVYAVGSNRAGAERATQRDFDAACAWIADQTTPEGPVMGRHPGDLAWLSRRLAVPIPDGDQLKIAEAIRRERVAFLVIDDDRYARSPDNPLRSLVTGSPWVQKVWGRGTTSVYRVETSIIDEP